MLRSAILFLTWMGHCVASFSPQHQKTIATASLEGEPTALVAGCVYALTGDYCETAMDLYIPDVEPLFFQRTFTSFWDGGSFLGGWSANTQCFLENCEGGYLFTQEHGGKVIFTPSRDQNAPYKVDLQCFKEGLTNCSGREIGGKLDWHNAHLDPFKGNGEITLGDGSRYQFGKKKIAIHKPNGYVLGISDPFSKTRKLSLKGLNGKERGWIQWTQTSPSTVALESSNGLKIQYTSKEGKRGSIFKISSEHFPEVTYIRSEIKKGEPVGRIQKKLPEGRFLWIDHYRSGIYGVGRIKVKVEGYDDPSYGKVYSLKEPVGEKGEVIATYRFIYHPDEGMTEVFDAYGHLTRYYGDSFGRLCAIEHYTGQNAHQLYCREALYWTQTGRLRSKALLDKDNNPRFCVHYKYDQKGNILTESVWGNLTGLNKNELLLSPTGVPSGGESFKRHYTYSTDGFNLKLSEKNRKQEISYKYHPGSDRLGAKLISDKRKIRIRYFYHYDAQGALAAEIWDDGCSEREENLDDVTERHIHRYISREEPPLGLPASKEEFYLDLKTQREIALSKTLWSYDRQGRKTEEQRYDANGELLFFLRWKYDPLGRLVKTVNALGNVTEYQYDQNGNRTVEQGPDPGHIVRNTYDLSNRLVQTEKQDKDGSVYTSCYTYYNTHQKYTETSPSGDVTRYAYDALGRLKIVQHPPIANLKLKKVYPKEKFEYDLQGFISKRVAPDGGITSIENTIQGKPCKIEYPDGSVERFVYNFFGDLVQMSGKGGETISTQRDFLSRPVLEEIYSPEGKLISKKEFIYNAFHLLSEKGSDGIETKYFYDGAGFLTKKTVGERTILYTYNHVGQIIQEKDFYGAGDEDFTEIHRTYDKLGRVVEEKTPNSWKSYTYTPIGKLKSVTHNSKNRHSTIRYRYDILGRILEEESKSGGKTTYAYELSKKKTIDPFGNEIVEMFDGRDNLIKRKLYDPLHVLQLSSSFYWDKMGRKVAQLDKVYRKNKLIRTCLLRWDYDLAGHLVGKIEGVSTSLQKRHLYQYDRSGRRIKWIKPDGVEIHYRYDCLGNLLELKSSDNSIHYIYRYNKQNHLERVEDCIQGNYSLSTWDKQGCLSHEMLANGLTLSFEWNWHGQIKNICLPDKSGITYSYENGRMKTVTRQSPKGEKLYQQDYLEWESDGSPVKIALPGNVGILHYQYHKDGLLKSVVSNQWKETALKYDLLGNLLSRTINGKQESFSYDFLSHLNSEKGNRYIVDPLGNWIAKNGVFYKINPLNQIEKAGEIECLYDLCGRLVSQSIKGKTITYRYDALDRLIEVQQAGDKITYTYDYAHRRMSKEANGNKTLFLYQGQNEIGEMDDHGNWLNLRILGVGKGAEIGASIAIELEETPYVPIHNSSGAVAVLLDLEGDPLESYTSTAYGEENGDFKNPWRYSSKRHDPETALVFFGRRYYIPELGRWLTPDPLEEEGGINLYAFVGGNPLTHIDLYGLLQERPSLLRKVGQILGTILKGIGDHLLPIPSIRDALSALGHRLKGGSRLNFRELCRNPHSVLGHLAAPAPEKNLTVAYIGGILNRPEDCFKAADELSVAYGGPPVHYCYNSSEGFVFDLLECAAQIIGIKTHTVELATQLLRERIQSVGEKGMVHLHLHSQGGLIGYRALQKLTSTEKKQVHVTTYGTAKLICSKELASVTNVISGRDPIPWIADPLGCARAYWTRSDQVKYVPSPPSMLAAHSLENYFSQMRIK